MRRRTFLRSLALSSTLTAGCSLPGPFGGHRPEWEFRAGTDTASLAVTDGSVFVASDENVYRLVPDTGKPEWTYEGDRKFLFALDVGTDVVGVGEVSGRVVAIDATDGSHRWTSRPITGDPVGGVAVSDTTGGLFATVTDGTVVNLDLETGDERWRSRMPGYLLDDPIPSDDTVFITSRDGYVYALDIDSGEEQWSFEVGSELFGTPTLTSGTVWVGSTGGDVLAIDGESGQQQWRYETGKTRVPPPAIDDDTAFIVSNSDMLMALDLDTRSVNWQIDEFGGSVSSPGIGPEHVYVGTLHYLNAFSKSSGEEVWKVETGAISHQTPIVGSELVFMSDDEGLIYAIPRI